MMKLFATILFGGLLIISLYIGYSDASNFGKPGTFGRDSAVITKEDAEDVVEIVRKIIEEKW